jgi:hypothetical protein
MCKCKDGYIGDGIACADINKCSQNGISKFSVNGVCKLAYGCGVGSVISECRKRLVHCVIAHVLADMVDLVLIAIHSAHLVWQIKVFSVKGWNIYVVLDILGNLVIHLMTQECMDDVKETTEGEIVKHGV